jgi:acetyltransferase-like isoleucine patch superfamily enzyme
VLIVVTINRDPTAFVHPSIVFAGEASIGFCSCVGHGTGDGETHIGDGVSIGAFCIISRGVHIADRVEVDHYCQIAHGAVIGTATRILYRAQVFEDVRIGKNCIIAGELVDRTVIEDEVTFQGDTAHSHRDPTCSWDDTEEPSPVIRTGSVVGIGALLIGGINIGPHSYVAAGEVVKCDVPRETVLEKGRVSPLSEWRGIIKVRGL